MAEKTARRTRKAPAGSGRGTTETAPARSGRGTTETAPARSGRSSTETVPARSGRSSTETAPARTRQTADARREALIDAAVEHFSQTGLHGTAVSAITDQVGITQPYAFSLFGTKKGLFLAAVERGFDRVEESFREAAAGAGEDSAFDAMKESYGAVLADRSLLLIQLQAYAASGDDEVRAVVRRRYAQLYDLVRELSGADREELTQFFAAGMLLNVAAALDLPEVLLNDTWLEDCLGLGDAG